MMLVRRFEEKAAQLYGKQKIKGFCHLYIGQEALVAAMKTANSRRQSNHSLSRPRSCSSSWYNS